MAKHWSEEEIVFLKENWGIKSINCIAQNLHRTTTAIERKADRLNLGPWLESGDYITLNQLWKSLGLGNGNWYRGTSWIKKRNFPIKYKKSRKRRTQIVYIEDFWNWAEINQDILDLSNMEPLSLGIEPDWVDNKRNLDKLKNTSYITTNWTDYEDNKLLDMLKSCRYTTKQIANTLHRTESAILQRASVLHTKYRPLPENKHIPWSEKELNILKLNIRFVHDYFKLCLLLPNRSEKAIKSKVYLLYGTQDLHKII